MITNRHYHRSTAAFLISDHRRLPSHHSLSIASSKSLASSFFLCKAHRSTDRDPVRKEKSREFFGGGSSERSVHYEVDVISWRERRIRGRVVVAADVDSVWSVLTDYDRLADFIPNLVYSGTVPCPHQGRIWLEQRGLQGALYWHIEARVVLDLQEFPYSAKGHELHFSMVEGDFKKFEGKWSVKAIPRSSKTTLAYEVNVIPRFNFSAMFIERIISSDLPVNLQALACRAETNSSKNKKVHSYRNATAADFKDPAYTIVSDPVLNKINNPPAVDLTENLESVASTLPFSNSTDLSRNWGIFEKICNLDKPCMVDEVHLRRFDGLLENGGVHRCIVASITVKAPIRDVWNVLTAYEMLPEIVPNLAICKILMRENNKVRILQEGCKGLLYMVLHARVILDLHERFEQEISFEQVEGDFDSFNGKWILQQLGNNHTLLKYSIDSKLHRDTFLSEVIVEEVVYEDLPSNLCAIRDFVEKEDFKSKKLSAKPNSKSLILQNEKKVQHPTKTYPTKVTSDSDVPNLPKRSKVPKLQKNIDVLKSEILKFISKHGQEGFMPVRKKLRMHGRVDIEKAIAKMGGFRKIAAIMNLSLAYKDRKPKGYWNSLENLQAEINSFQKNWGMDLTYMPSRKSFERAGRYDIARALEKWGGLHEVSRLLSLELRHPRKDSKSKDYIKPSNHQISQEKLQSKHVSYNKEKYPLKLKDLDINWLE